MFLTAEVLIVHFRVFGWVNSYKITFAREFRNSFRDNLSELQLASFFKRFIKITIVIVIREFFNQSVDQEFNLRVLSEISDINVI